MPKSVYFVSLVALVAGGWYFLAHYRIDGLESLQVRPRAGQAGSLYPLAARRADGTAAPPALRVATFNPGPLDRNKLNQPAVAGSLVHSMRPFDVIALQGIVARDQGVMVQLVELLNAANRAYDFVVPSGPDWPSTSPAVAFVFDQQTVEVDRRTVCEVQDPKRRFRRPPLLATFRARGLPAKDAFTFTLVNVHLDPAQTARDAELLDSLFRGVRDNAAGEDDVIVLGDLETDEQRLAKIARVPGLTWTLSGMPSTTRGTRQSDNILFDRRATAEYTGRSGVLDLMRELNLSIDEALAVSDHLPVWAEFSVFEGGQSGHVAPRTANGRQRPAVR
jgi:endonuclease/exonuclease/phosphatase family metal-dependent hydrolase